MHKTPVSALVPVVIAFAMVSLGFGAVVSEPIPLWPKGAPNEKGEVGEEHDTTKPGEGLVSAKG